MQLDLDHWLATVEEVHPNPYARLGRAEFLAHFQTARARLPDALDPLEFYAALQRLTALLRDSHTDVWYPRASRAYDDAWWPMDVVVRDGRLVVRTEMAGLGRGTEISSINRLASADLLRAAAELTSAENSGWALSRAQESLAGALWLAGARAPFQVVGRSPQGGNVLAAVEGKLPHTGASMPKPEPFTLSWLERDVALLAIRSMTDVPGFARFVEAAAFEWWQRRARGLIVDLRENTGGNTTVGELLLERITTKAYRMVAEKHWRVSARYQAQADYSEDYRAATPGTTLHYRIVAAPPRPVEPNYRGPVCFLIGPNTLSSGMMLANAVADYDLATMIGEPTTSPPNYFGEVFLFELPRTGLRAQASVAQFVRANGDVSSTRPVEPDIPLSPTFEQWVRREDPVLARAVSWIRNGS